MPPTVSRFATRQRRSQTFAEKTRGYTLRYGWRVGGLRDDGSMRVGCSAEVKMPAMDDRERLAQPEVRVEEQGGRLIELSQQIRNLDLKVDAQGQNLYLKIDALADRMDRKFDDLRSEMAKQFRWIIGVMVTLAGLFAAFAR